MCIELEIEHLEIAASTGISHNLRSRCMASCVNAKHAPTSVLHVSNKRVNL
jgi:hypothetical protein